MNRFTNINPWGILIAIVVSFACGVSSVSAHSGKARFHVVIDTDGAADDLRTLCMLLGNREAEVLAVVSSDGALPPAATARRVAALLHGFHHEGIPVGCGRPTCLQPPVWRAHSMIVDWGDTTAVADAYPTAGDLLVHTFATEPERITVVALGALTNWYDLLQTHPELVDRIERIVWYDDRTGDAEGANSSADRAAAQWVTTCGVPMEIVSADSSRPLLLDGALLDTLSVVAAEGNPYARKIVDTHRAAPLDALCRLQHLKTWDDWVAVRLYAPELFSCRFVAPSVQVCVLADSVGVDRGCAAIASVLRGKPDAESRVFYGFPLDKTLYAADVAPWVDEALQRHGLSEWRATVLTNELHGHLGIYATIGVKMGIRAREYFAIGVDDIAVTSFAGSRPPVSCLNDGLQVGTGGTVGHGLMTVETVESPRPEAVFRFKDKAIRLKLKPEYAARIREDVQRGVALYGPDSEAYWQYIRGLALRYWLEFDRHEIFELTVENPDGWALLGEVPIR
ncbi:MAG: nucleoside hydrolase [Alistipes sp.]|nr:nucleoside hydrolase [Alistipes sp.]